MVARRRSAPSYTASRVPPRVAVPTVQILSDLHFEFHKDSGLSFIKSLNASGVDVLIAAGDISICSRLEEALALLCEHYPHVVFVAGNHEYYRSSPREVAKVRARCEKRLVNLHWLERETTTVDGVRLVGTTLWFPDDPLSYGARSGLADFHLIRDFVPWVFDENKAAVRFLQKTVKEEDVVVTHYLPSQRSVHPQYKGHPLNPFFVCDVENVIKNNQPRLWVHGHGHTSVRYLIGNTDVCSNPLGYPHEQNLYFNERLMIVL